MRQARIYRKDRFAGMLTEDGGEYTFQYDEAYLSAQSSVAVSLTLPLQKEAFRSPVLFPFFDGLIPEGWPERLSPSVRPKILWNKGGSNHGISA